MTAELVTGYLWYRLWTLLELPGRSSVWSVHGDAAYNPGAGTPKAAEVSE